MRTLTDLFLNSLAEIYYAENQLLRTLPKLARADTDAELREGLESLLEETEYYVRKVEREFAEFGRKARAKQCDTIAGLLEQSNKMVSENKGLRTIDASLIAVAESESNTIRRHSSSQAGTCRLRRARYPTWPPGGKPIYRGALWKSLTGSG
jgi:ferritin-like metal-binding protein YciE